MSWIKDLLGLRKVTCGGPIDFVQWKLDQQVHGLRMILDDQGDVVGFPVVIVDPTSGSSTAVAKSPTDTLTPWTKSTDLSTNAPVTIRAKEAGKDHYLTGGFISSANASRAAAGLTILGLLDGTGHIFDLGIWLPAAAGASYSPPINFQFPGSGLKLAGDLTCRLDADLAAGILSVQTWGVAQ